MGLSGGRAAGLARAHPEARHVPRQRRLLRRLRFSGHDIDVAGAVRTAAYGIKRLDDIDLTRALAPDILRDMERDAPDRLAVPSGRHHRLEYHEDGTVGAAVKLQELFGLSETPRIFKVRTDSRKSLIPLRFGA